MSVLDPETESGQFGGGEEIATPHPTEADLNLYLSLPEDNRARIHQNEELRNTLWNSLSQNPTYMGSGPTEQASMLAMFGFPLNKVTIPRQFQMPPMDFSGQVPMEPAPMGQVPMARPPQPRRQDAQTWGQYLVQPNRPTTVTWPKTEGQYEPLASTPMYGLQTIPNAAQTFYQNLMGTYAQKSNPSPLEVLQDKPLEILRGLVAWSTPKRWQPPEMQENPPPVLSLHNAAGLASWYYITRYVPYLSMPGRALATGIETAGRTVGLPVLEKFVPSAAAWLVQHPGLTNRATAGLSESGAYAMLEIIRDGLLGGIKNGEWSEDELAKVWGPALFWNMVPGMGIGVATGVAAPIVKGVGKPIADFIGRKLGRGPAQTAGKVASSVANAADNGTAALPPPEPMPGAPGAPWGTPATAVEQGFPPTRPIVPEVPPTMQPPTPVNLAGTAFPPRTPPPPSPQAIRAQTTQAAAAEVDNALTLTKTIVSDVDGSMMATVPTPLYSKNFPTPEAAVRGDHILLKGKNRVALVLGTGENGLHVEEIGTSARYVLPFDSKQIKSISGIRGPLGPHDEVFDSAGSYTVDRLLPNGKAYVIGQDGRRLLKDPATLMTKEAQTTAKVAAEHAAAGIAGPVPEGGRIYQEFDVVAPKPDVHPLEGGYFVPGVVVSLADNTKSFIRRLVGGTEYKIPVSKTVSPTGKDLGAWEIGGADPWTVIATAAPGDPQMLGLSRMWLESQGKENGFMNASLALLRTWQGMQKVTKETTQRLMRGSVGVSNAADQVGLKAMTDAEKQILAEWKPWAQENILPRFNAIRIRNGQAPVSDVFDLPMLLAPEIVLNAGNRFTTGGVDIKQIAQGITRTGVGRGVTLSGEALQQFQSAAGGPERILGQANVDLHLTGDFFAMAKSLMHWAANEQAMGPISDAAKQGAVYARDVLGKNNLGLYLDWAAKSIRGRTSSAYTQDIGGGITRWLEPAEKALTATLSAKQSAALIDEGLDVPLLSHRFNLTHTDMFDVVGGMKRFSYAMQLGINMRPLILNFTQMITHASPTLPGRGTAANVTNLMALGEGYAKGSVAAATKFAGDTSAWAARNLGENLRPFWTQMANIFDTNALRKYKAAGLLTDVEDMFTDTASTGGRLRLVRDALLNQSLFTMKYSEVLNRVGTSAMVKRSYGEDIRRRMGWDPSDLDIKAAFEDLGKLQANASNFLYGKGFKSTLHERGGLGAPDTGNLFGVAMDGLAQFNTFWYKTMSLLGMEIKQFTQAQPNAVRMIVSEKSSDRMKDYFLTLRQEEVNQVFRTALIRTVAASAVGVLTRSAQIAQNLSVIGMATGFGVSPVISQPLLMVWHGLHGDLDKSYKEFKKIFTPAAWKKWESGRTLWEKTMGKEQYGASRGGPSFWEVQGVPTWGRQERR